jgi:hypothetical protein
MQGQPGQPGVVSMLARKQAVHDMVNWVQQQVTCKNTGGAKWKTRFGLQDYMLKHHGMVSEDSKAQWEGMLADHSVPKRKIGDQVRLSVMKTPRRAPIMVAPFPRS